MQIKHLRKGIVFGLLCCFYPLFFLPRLTPLNLEKTVFNIKNSTGNFIKAQILISILIRMVLKLAKYITQVAEEELDQ